MLGAEQAGLVGHYMLVKNNLAAAPVRDGHLDGRAGDGPRPARDDGRLVVEIRVVHPALDDEGAAERDAPRHGDGDGKLGGEVVGAGIVAQIIK